MASTLVEKPKVLTQDVPVTKPEEQGVVIVHCVFTGVGAIRIWPTTFLIDRANNARSKLLHAENISMAPGWTMKESPEPYRFTLYFESLPKGCTVFDLVEIIPQPGGFEISGIRRNTRDVYRVSVD